MRLPSALALFAVACTPALDWREVHHATAGVVAMFPCRPQHHIRSVMIGQSGATMHLMSCSAAGQTFGISYIDAPAVEAVGPALAALQTAAGSHIKAGNAVSAPFKVSGATSPSNSTLVSVDGMTPDGDRMQLQVGVFASGLRVYQATTFAPGLDQDAAQSFFSGIRIR